MGKHKFLTPDRPCQAFYRTGRHKGEPCRSTGFFTRRVGNVVYHVCATHRFGELLLGAKDKR